jgi:tetratricopeptide (TPR) repeat protein
MGKFSLFLFIVFLIVVGYFAMLNKEPVTFKVSTETVYEMPKVALILMSFAIGGAVMLLYFFIRDTRRFITNRQYLRRQKKEMKIQELYSKALNAILADNEEEARSALEEILEIEPSHIDALLRLGDISAGDEDFQKALNYYKKARDAKPQNIEVLFSLAKVMEKMGRESEAITYLNEIIEMDPDNLTALYMKRSILEKKGNLDDLINVQKQIIKSEHDEKDREREQKVLIGYKYEQGRTSLEAGEMEKARRTFRTIIRIDKGFVPAYLGYAETLLREDKVEEAIEFLEKGFQETSSMIVLARLEDLLINIGDPGRLIRFYRNISMRDPQNQVVRFFLGKLFYRLEMLDDAFDTLLAVDAAGNRFPELHQLLGNIYLRRGQCEKAVEEFKKVLDMKKTFRLPYCCNRCGYSSVEWSGRCPSCKNWNTYEFNLYGACKA